MLKREIVINQHLSGINPLQFGYEQCKPLHSFGPFVREYWLIHYVESGSGCFFKKGVTYQVQAGDMFIIAPYEETFYQADEANPWSYSWMGFTAADIPCNLQRAVLHCPAARAVFEDAKRCTEMDVGKSVFLAAKIWELLAVIMEQDTRPHTDYVQTARSIIHSSYMNRLTVSDIARSLHLNRSYFSDIFKQKMGVSPQQYLNTYRLKKAADLMCVYGQSPTLAALSTGYADVYTFSKMFKRHFGVSPRTYVQKAKNYEKET